MDLKNHTNYLHEVMAGDRLAIFQDLQAIVNNGRFLILPRVQIKGLASKILALNARQIPHDWEIRYGYRPLLLETLVDAGRFRGTCYRAANWGAVAWTRSTKLTVRPSKISTFIHW